MARIGRRFRSLQRIVVKTGVRISYLAQIKTLTIMTERQLDSTLKKVTDVLKKELQVPDSYKHYVYSAGLFPQNEKSIANAKKAVELLEEMWEMNADIHGHYEGPNFVIEEGKDNIEIYAESGSLLTLIDGCMAFAREKAYLDMKS